MLQSTLVYLWAFSTPKQAAKPLVGHAVLKCAAKLAAQSSSQLHAVFVMQVKHVQQYKVVWSCDNDFHTVPVVDDGAPK